MSIIATNRITTERNIEVVISLHRSATGDSVTMSFYSNGMSNNLHLTPKESFDLQKAINRTNFEINEDVD